MHKRQNKSACERMHKRPNESASIKDQTRARAIVASLASDATKSCAVWDVKLDGFVLIKIILDNVEPSTRLGAKDLEDKLSRLSVCSTGGNLKNFLTSWRITTNKSLSRQIVIPHNTTGLSSK